MIVAEPIAAFTDDEILDWHLNNWARWMHRGGLTRGYPGRACGCTSWGDGWDDDATYDRGLAQKAACVNALLEGMTPIRRAAISHCYLAAVFKFPRGNYAEELAAGLAEIARGLRSRGMWD